MGGTWAVSVGWDVVHVDGPAAVLHGEALPTPDRRLVRVCRVERPVVVLGSSQPADHVPVERAAALGIEVARRRSGGSAVLLTPADPVWIDLGIPRDDPLWSDDVRRSSGWVAAAWLAALSSLGVSGLVAHEGALVCSPWCPQACWAGVGGGELVVAATGAKVVGVSQRRTRAGALFQCAVHLRWSPGPLADALDLPPQGRAALAGCGAGLVDLLGRPVSADDVVAALVVALPA